MIPVVAWFSFSIIGCEKKSVEGVENNTGRDLVMSSIEAHGGSERWYANGALRFRWTYHMSDRGPQAIVDTVQTVDLSSLDVVHEVPGKEIRFGMNEGQAWISPKGSDFKPPVRFWALTPFYFMGIPFIFNDENANFEQLPETMSFEGKDYVQVKVSYNAAAGDTPDDYYVLLIDPETQLTRGAYYIVTSPLVAPDGPTPPKFITLDELTEIDGIQLAGGHRTFAMTDGEIGEQMRFTEVSEVKFIPSDEVDLAIPNEELIIK